MVEDETQGGIMACTRIRVAIDTYWRKYHFRIGRAVQERLDKLLQAWQP